MNAEQIRAEAIERIACKMFEIDPRERDRWESAYLAPEVRDHYRKYAGMFVDALGDLLPTHTETCSTYTTTFVAYVTDWQPIEGAEAA